MFKDRVSTFQPFILEIEKTKTVAPIPVLARISSDLYFVVVGELGRQ